MALPVTHLASGAVGLVGGIAITVAVINVGGPGNEPVEVPSPPAITRAQVEAAIAADPSYCIAGGLEVPSPEEAQAAFHKAKGETFPNVSITLGQCDKDMIGPGVACMSRILWGPDGEPAERLIGFSKSPDGWVATLY